MTEMITEEELADLGFASALAQLSQFVEGGVPRFLQNGTPSAFDEADVDLSSGSWVERLSEVLPWLALGDRQLNARDMTGVQFLDELYVLLPSAEGECGEGHDFVVVEGVPRLTALGAQRLQDRLNAALQAKEAVKEWVDDDLSDRECRIRWQAFWEERSEDGGRGGLLKSITASTDNWPIREFQDRAEMGFLDLDPPYQRDVVWSNTDAQKLVESILRGIPLPSVILYSGDDGQTYQIVDGKQRLTAILRFMGAHPKAVENAASFEGGAELMQKEPRRFFRSNRTLKGRQVGDLFMPFKLPRFSEPGDPLGPLSGKFFAEIVDEVLPGNERISTRFRSAATRYRVPVIVYEKTDVSTIHHVFNLYNKQGKKLNAEELRNAVYHSVRLTTLLLLLSGDRDNVDQLARYLPREQRTRLPDTAEAIGDLGFGVSRFRRTKVVSWAVSLMVLPAAVKANRYTTPSTSAHINRMLHEIQQRGSSHPLHGEEALIRITDRVLNAVETIAETNDGWPSGFRNRGGRRGDSWEDLPFVAAFLTTMLLDEAGRIEAVHDIEKMEEFCAGIRHPEQVQNRDQWQFIASFAIRLLRREGVDLDNLGKRLETSYGSDCIPGLLAISKEPA